MENEDLQAAEAHIARLEEELLRRKDLQYDYERLRAEHQKLRRAAEGRLIEFLSAPARWWRKRKAKPEAKVASYYLEWFGRHRTSEKERASLKARAKAWGERPLVSILMPTFESDIGFLRSAIESVHSQIYENWELVVADDNSKNPAVRRTLNEFAAHDGRIRLAAEDVHGGISAALNRALALARGDWIALLDHDDLLEPDALFRVIESLTEDDAVDLFYSDEDKISDGAFVAPLFKPDWSPDLFLSHDYLGHLVVARRELFAIGFRSEFDGAQDYELLLRVSEQTHRFRHLPRILYHWRRTPQSTAHNIRRKPGALEAGRRALGEHMRRVGQKGRVTVDWETHAYRFRRTPASGEISVVGPGDDWRSGTGEFVLFLDEGLTVSPENWSDLLLEYLADERVGAVDGRIISAEGLVESAGYVLAEDQTFLPAFSGWQQYDKGANRLLQVPRNCSALNPACFLTRRELLHKFGQELKPQSPCSVFDFFLQLRDAGWRLVSIPYVEMRREQSTRAVGFSCRTKAQRWPGKFRRDPFYNPNLTRARADFSY